MYETNEKIDEIRENYKCTKQVQNQLHLLSEQLSDEYVNWYNKTHEDKIPSIKNTEHRQWVKLQKIGQKEIFGIEFTLQQLQTIHQNILDPEQFLEVVSQINALYEQLQHMKDNKKSKEYRELYRQYLNLKTKLEETKVKPKPIQLPVEVAVDFKYDVATIKFLLKNTNVLYQDKYIDIRLDIESALLSIKFTRPQIVALNQAMTTGVVDSGSQTDYKKACEKISHALNHQNIFKKCK